MEVKSMTDSMKLVVVIVLITSIWLFTQLSSVLMPFFVAALLAYLGDPLVDKLESWKLSSKCYQYTYRLF